MERYFICASASSMLKMTASGCPRSTGEPNSTDTCRTMPPTSALTLVSRYALDMTVPGTVMADTDGPLRTTTVLILIQHPLRSATRRADGPLNLHRGVIDLLQRVRVAVLGLDVATLLGDDVEKRAPTQFIALPNDVQVPARDVADAALVDRPAPPCRFILHERRLDLLAYRERRELHAPLRGVCLSPRGRDVALVPVADWEHDAHAAAEVVEDVLDWARLPLSRRTHEVEAEVLAHVTQVHAGVPAAFCLLLQDPRPRRRGVGTGRFEVCPAGQRPRDRLTTIGGRYRRAEIATERERRVWRHAGERLELQRRHLDAAGEQFLARVQPIDLHQREVLLQRGGRALFDALLDDPERLAVDLQQTVGDTKIALRRQHLPRLHAHLGPQPAFAVPHLSPLHGELAFGHGDAPLLPSVQVERER